MFNQYYEYGLLDELQKIAGLHNISELEKDAYVREAMRGVSEVFSPHFNALKTAVAHQRLGGGRFSKFPSLDLVKGPKTTFKQVGKDLVKDPSVQALGAKIGRGVGQVADHPLMSALA